MTFPYGRCRWFATSRPPFRCDGRARRRCPRLSFRRRGRPIVAAIRWVIESTRLLRVPRVTNAEEGRAPGSRTDEATSARNTRKAAYSISAYSPRAGLGGNSEPSDRSAASRRATAPPLPAAELIATSGRCDSGQRAAGRGALLEQPPRHPDAGGRQPVGSATATMTSTSD
jgi:hypothetical protein